MPVYMLFPLLRKPSTLSYLAWKLTDLSKPNLSSPFSGKPSWIPYRKVIWPSSSTHFYCWTVLYVLTCLSLFLFLYNERCKGKRIQLDSLALRQHSSQSGHSGNIYEMQRDRLEICGKVIIKGIYQLWLSHWNGAQNMAQPLRQKKRPFGSSLQSGFPCQSKLSWRGTASAIMV